MYRLTEARCERKAMVPTDAHGLLVIRHARRLGKKWLSFRRLAWCLASLRRRLEKPFAAYPCGLTLRMPYKGQFAVVR